jgi:hypothetical protein
MNPSSVEAAMSKGGGGDGRRRLQGPVFVGVMAGCDGSTGLGFGHPTH